MYDELSRATSNLGCVYGSLGARERCAQAPAGIGAIGDSASAHASFITCRISYALKPTCAILALLCNMSDSTLCIRRVRALR
jgi:hypothetical protein